jgi:DNA adenine methylase
MNGYPTHADRAVRFDDGSTKILPCAGLLMMPEEAGMRSPEPTRRFVVCSACSPSQGLVEVGSTLYALARAASEEAGVNDLPKDTPITLGHLGGSGRMLLDMALRGEFSAVRKRWRAFRLCKAAGVVNPMGTPTETGWRIAAEADWPVTRMAPEAPPEAASVILAKPAPEAPAVEARSPWRWVGGKGALLPGIMAAMPDKFGRLLVPFVGGGALVFAMPGRVSYISDANTHLIGAYACIRDRVEDVVLALQDHKNDRDYYDSVVESFNDGYGDDVWRAAAFLYMNKVGFNGLCRYNRRGGYNVPFGDNPKATICDADNLRACSAALQGVDIVAEDFRAVEERAQPGDVLYLDPPYLPESKTASFTGYWGRWGDAEHEACAALFRRLAARGVHVLASNSDTPKVRELYAGFEIRALTRANSVNSKASARGGKTELLILGGTWTPRGAT